MRAEISTPSGLDVSRRVRRRTRAAVAAAVIGVLCASTTSAADTHAAAVSSPHGFDVVQYAADGPSTVPWTARILSSSASLTTTSGPRVAADGDGGTQVAFRNALGQVIWMDGARIATLSAVDVSTFTGVTAASPPVPTVGPAGRDEIFCITPTGHLVELALGIIGRLPSYIGPTPNPLQFWSSIDLTVAASGPAVTGTPSVAVVGATTEVFARTAAGQLTEYVDDDADARVWNAYDLSVISGGPKIESDPAAYYDPTSKLVEVAAAELGPTKGDLVVYAPTDADGRIWTDANVSSLTHTGPVASDVAAAVVAGTTPLLVAGLASGDLAEYEATDTDGTTTWAATNLTTSVTAAPEIAGSPSIAVDGTHVVVAAAAAGWGDLFEWANSGTDGAYEITDVSFAGSGPTRTVAGSPAVTFLASTPVIFTAGDSIPAPEGTGVYAIPSDKWATAIEDGWPILGDTGGLGTQCSPWTGYPTPASGTPPDESVGEAIQQGHVRTTWLSFWTVSGPGTTPSTGCAAQKGATTPQTFYQHGFAAGAWVATQIDTYRSDGLFLKPDWVIFDPEGYPDNHSGLWGPTTPAAKLAVSVDNWYEMLAGWRAGIASVDPTLKAALYANQYEYMTYKLYGQPLPTFIAGAFAQQTVKGKTELVAPTRTAFGSNILGFVMFNTFTPSCAQVTDERLLLTEAPWDGSYNTVQTTPGSYCPPGAAP